MRNVDIAKELGVGARAPPRANGSPPLINE